MLLLSAHLLVSCLGTVSDSDSAKINKVEASIDLAGDNDLILVNLSELDNLEIHIKASDATESVTIEIDGEVIASTNSADYTIKPSKLDHLKAGEYTLLITAYGAEGDEVEMEITLEIQDDVASQDSSSSEEESSSSEKNPTLSSEEDKESSSSEEKQSSSEDKVSSEEESSSSEEDESSSSEEDSSSSEEESSSSEDIISSSEESSSSEFPLSKDLEVHCLPEDCGIQGDVSPKEMDLYLDIQSTNITATPNFDFEFAGWTTDDESILKIAKPKNVKSKVTLIADGQPTLYANFTAKEFSIEIQSNAASVDCSAGNNSIGTTLSYTQGDEIELSCSADEDFKSWTVEGFEYQESGSTITITAITDVNASITATFEEPDLNLPDHIRRFYFFEDVSAEWCDPCAVLNEDLHAFMKKNEGKILGVAYMYDNVFGRAIAAPRTEYYGASSYPTFYMNGEKVFSGYGSGSLESYYMSDIPYKTDTLAQIGPIIKASKNGGTISGNVQVITLEKPAGDLRLTIMAVQDHVHLSSPASNAYGTTDYYHVLREVAVKSKDINNISPANPITVDFSVDIKGSWDSNEMSIIAIIQNDDNKEILNAAQVHP